MVFDILEGRFRHAVIAHRHLRRIIEQAQAKRQGLDVARLAANRSPGGVEGLVLPGAVGVGLFKDLPGGLQLLRALDQMKAVAAGEAVPVAAGFHVRLHMAIGVKDQGGVPVTHGAVPVVGHAVVPEAIDVIAVEPVVVDP